MSDPNTVPGAQNPAETSAAQQTRPQGPQSMPQQVPQAPAGPPPHAGRAAQTAPAAPAGKRPKKAAGEQDPHRLSTFLKVSIILLAALTVASISLLFIGDFEGKVERVFSTFVLFAVFVLFTALDTRREQRSEWYAPVALIANTYILGLLLIVIWMTPYAAYTLLWEIFWKSVFVILVTRLVILCCQLLLRAGDRLPAAVTRFAFVTSVLAVLSGILFTAPVGIEAFDLHIPDLYWKIATALLILTALGLSITLLLRWSYGADEREARRRALQNRQPVAYPAQPPVQSQQPFAQAQPLAQAPQQQLQGGPQLLPWPTFADGTPLPMGPDGQPDFSVLGSQAPRQ